MSKSEQVVWILIVGLPLLWGFCGAVKDVCEEVYWRLWGYRDFLPRDANGKPIRRG